MSYNKHDALYMYLSLSVYESSAMFVFCTHIHAICLSLMYCISIVHGTFVVCDAHTFLVWHRLGAYIFSEDRDEELCRQEVVILSPMSDPRTQVPRGVIYIYMLYYTLGESPTNSS